MENVTLTDISQEDGGPVRSPMSVENNQANVTPQIARHTTRKRKCSADKKLDEAFEILSNATKVKETNECQLFGQLVGRKLQKYSSESQIAVQEAIMSILFKADRGYYDRRSAQDASRDFYYQSHSTAPSGLQQYSLSQHQIVHNPVPQRSHSAQSQASQYSPLPSPALSHTSTASDYLNSDPQSQNTNYLLLSSQSSCSNTSSQASSILTKSLSMADIDAQEFIT